MASGTVRAFGVEEAGGRCDGDAACVDVDVWHDLGDEWDEHFVSCGVPHVEQILGGAVGDVDDLTDEGVVLIDLESDEVVEVPSVGVVVFFVRFGEDEGVADLLGAVAIGYLVEGQEQTVAVPPRGLQRQRSDIGIGGEGRSGVEPFIGSVGAHLDGEFALDSVRLAQPGDHRVHTAPRSLLSLSVRPIRHPGDLACGQPADRRVLAPV